MAALLQAIIDDPSPGPSVAPPVVIAEGGGSRLTSRQQAAALQTYHESYDDQHGGWDDVHKFIDAAALELTYSEGDAGRRALGMPRIDVHEYARETGWAIRALCKYYDVTGDEKALSQAIRAARWSLANRLAPSGAFRHDLADLGGPFLDDSLAMGQAFVALYRSTGDREWLGSAQAVLAAVNRQLRDPKGGFVAAPAAKLRRGVFRNPIRQPEENAALARLASLMHHYTGDADYQKMASHAMRYLVGFSKAAPEQLRAEILLADRELSAAPVHITIVGGKSDSAARKLHATALRYPSDYLQVDWWDPAEGRLPNPEISYPQLDRAAAFACTASACSMPVFNSAEIEPAVRAALAP
jgi:uncharacterized protein